MIEISTCELAIKNGCIWDETVCECAAEYGQLECLKYAHDNGAGLGYEIYEEACKNMPMKTIVLMGDII